MREADHDSEDPMVPVDAAPEDMVPVDAAPEDIVPADADIEEDAADPGSYRRRYSG